MHWKQKLAKEISALEKLDQTPSIRAKIARLKQKRITNHKGKNQQSKKTHCPRGHKYTKSSVYKMKDGSKRCKVCHRRAAMEYYREHKQKKVE